MDEKRKIKYFQHVMRENRYEILRFVFNDKNIEKQSSEKQKLSIIKTSESDQVKNRSFCKKI